MVRLQTLDLRIGVRVPASQPLNVMKFIAFCSLAVAGAGLAWGQNQPVLTEKAPAPVEEALRARVNKFYGLFGDGKFKEAYLMVADDSQDKYFEMAKDQYKGCEIIRINYTENFTKATVVTGCKREWRFHGTVTPITFPLTSTWETVNGEWFWHYEKPTMVATPFSPSGFIPVAPDAAGPSAPMVPPDLSKVAKDILSKIGIDKSSVKLFTNQRSQEVIHLRNDMPGEVAVKLDDPHIPGLQISLGKAKLAAHDQTTIFFEFLPPQGAQPISSHQTVKVHIDPTEQVFPIDLVLASQNDHAGTPPASQK